MENTIIPLRSYTEAKKAARFLAQSGIKASVVKTGSGRMGCSFGIKTTESPDIVCRLLRGAGIRCGDSMPFPPPPPPFGPRPPKPPKPPRPPRR